LPGEAQKKVAEMCERLLANPVIEEYKIEILNEEGRDNLKD
jgi:phosphoribosylformylglycinamidine synthase PurS subunit